MQECNKKVFKRGMKNLYSIRFLLISIAVQILTANSFAQTLRHTEILGRPTANSITVQLYFNETVECSVQYGTVPGNYTAQTIWQNALAGSAAELIIPNLQSNTQYYYRVCYRFPGATLFNTRPEFHFRTQKPAGNAFSFVIEADPHVDEQTDTAIYQRCLQNELDDNPDFMIDLGDFLMTDKLKNSSNIIPHDTITFRCHLLRSFYEKLNHSVPLFIALGNHEGEAGWNLNGTADNIAVWDAVERKKYFPNPYPDNFYAGDTTHVISAGQRGNYYAWTWGDALFIVLDPYWYTDIKPDSLHGWNWTLGKRQYDWLKATLMSSRAKFKFVFAHQLIGGDPEGRGGVEFADRYEWGGNNLDGTAGFNIHRPGWYKPIKDLLVEYHVNIFFHGHDHFFAKQEKSCLIYQETPQPSHPNYQTASDAGLYGYVQGQILPNSGHLRVTVSPSSVTVAYIRAYTPANENATRHNKDVSASYFIGAVNCYDSVSTPVLWNADYANELVFPNPFMKATTIQFANAISQHVQLLIYNTSGVFVRQLLAGNLVPIGKYQVSWDGKDQMGQELPSGVYFYHLKDETGKNKSGKIVLTR